MLELESSLCVLSALAGWLVALGALAAPLLALVHALLHPLDYWPVADEGARWAVDEEAVPLLGSLTRSLLGRASLGADLAALYRRHPGAAAVAAFGWRARPCVVLRWPHLVQRALAEGPVPDGGLASAPRPLRDRLSPLLLAGRVDATARLMVDCADQLVQLLTERADAAAQPAGGLGGVEVEVLGPLHRYCTAVVGSCAFGVACNCVQDPDLELHRVARAARVPRALSLLALGVATTLPVALPLVPSRMLCPAAACFYVDMLSESAAFRERTRTRRRDFVDLLMASRGGGGLPLADKDRRRHCALAYDVVAAETYALHALRPVARAVAGCLAALARDRALQRRVAAEVRRARRLGAGPAGQDEHRDDGDGDGLGSGPDALGLQVLQRSPLLEQVVLEALRLWPPTEVMAVEANESLSDMFRLPWMRGGLDRSDAKSETSLLRPGIPVFVSVRALHEDPNLYPNPLHFETGRFSAAARRARSPGAYLPFGELPPSPDSADDSATGTSSPCSATPSGLPPPAQSTGARLALQAMSLCLAALLADLDFGVSSVDDSRRGDVDDDDIDGDRDPEEVWLTVQRRRPTSDDEDEDADG